MSMTFSAVAGAAMVLAATQDPEWSLILVGALIAASVAKYNNL